MACDPIFNQLEEELIQVAAVAVAIVEDLRHEEAMAGVGTTRILSDIFSERLSQDKKWGPQHRPIHTWLAILGEEYGEACRAGLPPTIRFEEGQHA